MKQGEIWFADLNPTMGSEQAGYRPVLIVSGNLANTYAPVVVCCPLTSQLKHYHGNPILQPDSTNGLSEISEVLIIHIRSISKVRLKEKIGKVEKETMIQFKKSVEQLFSY